MTVHKRARRAWKAAELEPITLHECRHTFASLLIDSGANPKAIQTFMGHSKIQTTFDTYGHLMPGSMTRSAGAWTPTSRPTRQACHLRRSPEWGARWGARGLIAPRRVQPRTPRNGLPRQRESAPGGRGALGGTGRRDMRMRHLGGGPRLGRRWDQPRCRDAGRVRRSPRPLKSVVDARTSMVRTRARSVCDCGHASRLPVPSLRGEA